MIRGHLVNVHRNSVENLGKFPHQPRAFRRPFELDNLGLPLTAAAELLEPIKVPAPH